MNFRAQKIKAHFFQSKEQEKNVCVVKCESESDMIEIGGVLLAVLDRTNLVSIGRMVYTKRRRLRH